MEIYPIKAFSDNYIWLLERNTDVVVVDPGEPLDVLEHINHKNLNLKGILLTHNHDDHTGGVREILEIYPNTPVYGPEETKDLADHIVEEGDTFELLNESFQILKTAGHTEGHISFLTEKSLFCGDALFSGGCGRVFTGDYEAQYDALQKFRQLDNEVLAYPAHEYTYTNLKFAHSVVPENNEVATTLEEVAELTEKKLPTLPTTIGREKEINLFLKADSLAEFIELRNARDHF